MARRNMPTAPPPPRTQVLRAAATRIKVDPTGKANKPPRESWQSDAWDVYDMVGEVKQATTFLANVVSNVRVFVAVRPDDPEADPEPITGDEPGAKEAEAILERLRIGSVYGGLGGLLAEAVVNVKVAGEFWLVGEPPARPDPTSADIYQQLGDGNERWNIMSVDEVKVGDRGEVELSETPGGTPRKVQLARAADPTKPDDTEQEGIFLLRCWQRHPRFSQLADSALRGVLTECDELAIMSRSIRSAARNRAAGNGLLVVASEYNTDPVSPEEGDEATDPEVSPFMARFTQALLEPIGDETSPDAVVPVVVRAPAQVIKDAPITHVTLDRPMDAESANLRKELIERLAHCLDIPVEQLLGMAKVNHWTAWQVDDASWARYGRPVTRMVLDSWTMGVLWPGLLADGVAPEDARRLCLWFDPAEAIVDPDYGATADSLFDRGSISWEAHRSRLGAGEDEAPTPEELQQRADLGLLKGGGQSAASGQGPPSTSDGGGNASARTVRPFRRRPAAASVAAAAGGATLGRRLMRIDRTLRTRLGEAADAAMRAMLSRAGARIRSAVTRPGSVQAAALDALDGVPNAMVASRLGPSLVAALGLADDQLVQGDIDALRDKFTSRVSDAQARTRAELADEFDLDDGELAQLEQRQNRDRDEAWLWLSAALLLLARERLYEPNPAAPDAGEFDAAATVPTGLLREALARAGGGLPAPGQPMGGVATGVDVMDLWARHGQVVAGWEWVYGDPSARTTPFDPHLSLDGVQFDTWEDPVLTNTEGWPDVDFFRPGDHDWCQCDFVPVPVGETADSAAPAAV